MNTMATAMHKFRESHAWALAADLAFGEAG